MELEKYCIAEQYYKKICRFKESIQQMDEALDLKSGIRKQGFIISVPLGWGSHQVDIPEEVLEEVFGIIKKELQRQITELVQQFKEL